MVKLSFSWGLLEMISMSIVGITNFLRNSSKEWHP